MRLRSADDVAFKKEWAPSPIEMAHEANAEHTDQSPSSPSLYWQTNSTNAGLNTDSGIPYSNPDKMSSLSVLQSQKETQLPHLNGAS